MARRQRVALVTGANKGIGFETARQLVREDFRVFLGARDEEAGKSAAEKLNQETRNAGKSEGHGSVTFLRIDIADRKSIRVAAEEFGKQSDRLDALVNNAGIALDDDEDVLKITPEIF